MLYQAAKKQFAKKKQFYDNGLVFLEYLPVGVLL